MLKKLLISTLLGFYLLFTVSVPLAQAQWYNQSFKQFYTQVYGPTTPESEIFGERYTAAQTQWVVYSLASLILNQLALFFTQGDSEGSIAITNFVITGDIDVDSVTDASLQNTPPNEPAPSLAKQIFLTDRPISAITYFKQKTQSINLVSDAKAQTASTGFGFEALSPVQGLWRASRNISYSLFVLATIALAFMIMFRIQISPRVVITVQSAIPKIAIALILVTFSYAIAGFLIDLMYVSIGLMSLLLSQAGGPGNASAASIFQYMTQGPSGGEIFGGAIGIVLGIGLLYLISIIGFFTGAFFTADFAGSVALGLFAIVLSIVFILTALFIFVKLIFTLIKAFAMTLLLTIAAPIQITAGLVFSGAGFSSWLKAFISNLMIFPLASLLLFLSVATAYISYNGFSDDHPALETVVDQVGGGAVSAITGTPRVTFSIDPEGTREMSRQGWPPLFYMDEKGIYIIFLVMSYVLLALSSKSEGIIKGFMSGRGFGFGSAIGEATGPASSAGIGTSRAGADYLISEAEGGRAAPTTTISSALRRGIGVPKK